MTAADTSAGATWDAAWRRLGESVATAPNVAVPGFVQAYRDFGRWAQTVVTAAPATELHRHLADAAERTARQVSDPATLQPSWSVVPTALLAALPNGPMAGLAADAFERVARWADEFAALPLLGPYRGWAECALALQRAVLAERAAATRMTIHYRTVSAAALADFANYLRADDGPPITTLRALYGAWIERAERAYAAHVMSADFARDFSAWVNAGSALRAASAGLNERVATSFDWPQRAEINALLRRQRELEREIAELRARTAAAAAAAVAADTPVGVAVAVASPAVEPVVQPTRTRAGATRPPRRKADVSPRPTSTPRTKAPRKRKAAGTDEFDIAGILTDDT